METLVKDEIQAPAAKTAAPAPAKAPAEAPAHEPDPRREEIDELLRIKRRYKIEGTRVPCPACAMVVENTANRCPFCDSDIAAGTALARETTRRLRELQGEIDAEHTVRTAEPPKRRGFLERLQYLFEGDPAPVKPPAIDPHAPRLLKLITVGDSLKVLDEDGPWLKVKTMAGAIGWVYSTVRKDPS